jgi:hemerythrin-like domain-containing protein
MSKYARALRGWALIHQALRRGLDAIVRESGQPLPAGERAAFADYCERFSLFLHVHHDGEEEVIFPIMAKAAARAAMTETTNHLTGWKGDHDKLLTLLRAFDASIAAFKSGGPQEPVAKAATAVRAQLFPHLDSEEATLNEATLAKMMTGDEAEEMVAAASQHGKKNAGPRGLMFAMHNLTGDEQRFMFGDAPWFVRKVLFKRIFARNFRHCVKYAHTASIEL